MTSQEQIEKLSQEIFEKKMVLSKLRRDLAAEPVQDYALKDWRGETVWLSSLFGDKSDLLVIHNMGKGCTYCTMWADGFVSVLPHIENRAAFVVVSPDLPEVQKDFAENRGWTFKMVSAKDSDFSQDMGFADGKRLMPGVSAFHKAEDGKLYRTNKDVFGPGDDYSAPWHLFDLLKGGRKDWSPRYSYE
ncbi:MAG: DUF899 family protein [Trueperaceae bacterium]|nr:DUF899 family protein [Trueperaceae bacterium]